MELYSLYNLAYNLIDLFSELDLKTIALSGAIVGGVIWVLLFILQGFGLRAMAKRLGMQKRWLAFVPFANLLYMGKIVGDCSFFGQRMKNTGLFVMIAQILMAVGSLLYIFAECYLLFNFIPMQTDLGVLYWTNLKGFALVVYKFYEVGSLLLSLLTLVAEILLVILMLGLLKKYATKNHVLLAVVSFLIPISRFIIVFVVRNNDPIDYEAYVRRQQEAYRQRYYGNYNGGYNHNGYGGYNNPPQGGYAPPPQEDPFGEFSSQDKNEPFEDFKGDKPKGDDDFFN